MILMSNYVACSLIIIVLEIFRQTMNITEG